METRNQPEEELPNSLMLQQQQADHPNSYGRHLYAPYPIPDPSSKHHHPNYDQVRGVYLIQYDHYLQIMVIMVLPHLWVVMLSHPLLHPLFLYHPHHLLRR